MGCGGSTQAAEEGRAQSYSVSDTASSRSSSRRGSPVPRRRQGRDAAAAATTVDVDKDPRETRPRNNPPSPKGTPKHDAGREQLRADARPTPAGGLGRSSLPSSSTSSSASALWQKVAQKVIQRTEDPLVVISACQKPVLEPETEGGCGWTCPVLRLPIRRAPPPRAEHYLALRLILTGQNALVRGPPDMRRGGGSAVVYFASPLCAGFSMTVPRSEHRPLATVTALDLLQSGRLAGELEGRVRQNAAGAAKLHSAALTCVANSVIVPRLVPSRYRRSSVRAIGTGLPRCVSSIAMCYTESVFAAASLMKDFRARRLNFEGAPMPPLPPPRVARFGTPDYNSVGAVSFISCVTGETVVTMKSQERMNSPIVAMAFAGDGQTLFTVTNYEIMLWDINKGRHKCTLAFGAQRFELPYEFCCCDLSPDARTLVTGGTASDGGLMCFFAAAPDPKQYAEFTLFDGAVTCVKFCPKGDYLAAGDETGAVNLIGVHDQRLKHHMNCHNLSITAIVYDTPWTLLTMDNGWIRRWRVSQGHTKGKLRCHVTWTIHYQNPGRVIATKDAEYSFAMPADEGHLSGNPNREQLFRCGALTPMNTFTLGRGIDIHMLDLDTGDTVAIHRLGSPLACVSSGMRGAVLGDIFGNCHLLDVEGPHAVPSWRTQ
eukprot:TRINITY_DN619_c0_g2_i1.p1 TRINITY_DN619_c0_g2~~TRINITY_DN619_c0_g2_i1.p1  ORF type:complete len:658 (+),score=119.26 TRINITY_DN619_c0_g2_i1:3035-5008(+)